MPPAIWSKAWAVQSLIRVGDVRGKIELAENPYYGSVVQAAGIITL